MPIDLRDLSDYQRLILEETGVEHCQSVKLFPCLEVHKAELMPIALLKFGKNMGIEIHEVHTVWSFYQST